VKSGGLRRDRRFAAEDEKGLVAHVSSGLPRRSREAAKAGDHDARNPN
jgi:hypothetical protein